MLASDSPVTNQIFPTKLIFQCWPLPLSLCSFLGKHKPVVYHPFPKHREASCTTSAALCLPPDEGESFSVCSVHRLFQEFIASFRSSSPLSGAHHLAYVEDKSLSQSLSALLPWEEVPWTPRREEGASYSVNSSSNATTPPQTVAWPTSTLISGQWIHSLWTDWSVTVC